MQKLKSTQVITLIAIFLYFLTYSNLIFSPYLYDMDYPLVIDRLRHIYSLSDYLRIKQNILDIQPLRDFFFIILNHINTYTGHQFFGIANLLVWLGIVYNVKKLFNYIAKDAYLWPLILLFHPLMSWPLSWPTALKHLLSVYFISLTLRYSFQFYRNKGKSNTGIKVYVSYLASILCHPITILYPFSFLIGIWSERKKKYPIALISFLVVTMVSFLAINLVYYSKIYPLQIGANKLDQNFLHALNLSKQLLAVSRSFTQIFIPIKFAAEYSVNSLFNLFGLPIFLYLTYLFYKKFSLQKTVIMLSLLFFPLLTVYTRATNIFVSDTYLIVSLIITIGAFAYYFKDNHFNKTAKSLLYVLVLFFMIKSGYESRLTDQELSNNRISHQREPNCRNALAYAFALLKESEIQKFQKITQDAINNKCIIVGTSAAEISFLLYEFYIFLSDDLDISQKKMLLKSSQNKSIYTLKMLEQLGVTLTHKNEPMNLDKLNSSLKQDQLNKIIENYKL